MNIAADFFIAVPSAEPIASASLRAARAHVMNFNLMPAPRTSEIAAKCAVESFVPAHRVTAARSPLPTRVETENSMNLRKILCAATGFSGRVESRT